MHTSTQSHTHTSTHTHTHTHTHMHASTLSHTHAHRVTHTHTQAHRVTHTVTMWILYTIIHATVKQGGDIESNYYSHSQFLCYFLIEMYVTAFMCTSKKCKVFPVGTVFWCAIAFLLLALFQL